MLAPVAWMLSGLLALLIAALGFIAIRSSGQSSAGAIEASLWPSIWQGIQLVWAIAIVSLLLAFSLYLANRGAA
jgi:hypothetical protein